MWMVFALLSAFFAAVTSILAKVGIAGMSPYLATAVRTVVVLLMAWAVVLAGGSQGELFKMTPRNWLFLVLSGIATGLSWLFYFLALDKGDVSKVAPIDKSSLVLVILFSFLFLHEKMTPGTLAGGALITAGTLVIVFWK